MFIKALGVFIMFVLGVPLVLINLYDATRDSGTRHMVILAGGGFWLIASKMIWDYMWFVF